MEGVIISILDGDKRLQGLYPRLIVECAHMMVEFVHWKVGATISRLRSCCAWSDWRPQFKGSSVNVFFGQIQVVESSMFFHARRWSCHMVPYSDFLLMEVPGSVSVVSKEPYVKYLIAIAMVEDAVSSVDLFRGSPRGRVWLPPQLLPT